MDARTNIFTGLGALTSGITNFFFGAQQAQNSAAGDPFAASLTTLLTIFGILLLIVGLAKLNVGGLAAGIILLIGAPYFAGILAKQLGSAPNTDVEPPKNQRNLLGGGGEAEPPSGNRLTGTGEYHESNAIPLNPTYCGLLVRIDYENGTYRIFPETQSVVDLDVSGGPRPIAKVHIYAVNTMAAANNRFYEIKYKLTIKIDDKLIKQIEDQKKFPSPTGKWAIYLGTIDGKSLEPYVKRDGSVLDLKLDYSLTRTGIVLPVPEWGSAEVKFNVAFKEEAPPQGGHIDLGDLTKSYDKCMEIVGGDEIYSDYCRCVVRTGNPYSSECTQQLHSIMLSSIAVDTRTGLNLQMVLTLLQIVFYIAVIYDVLRRR